MQRRGNSNRSRYEDHKQAFLDWAQESEETLLGRAINVIRDQKRMKAFFLVLSFSMIISIWVFVRFDSPVEIRIGDVLSSDFISPISFEMTDEATTEEKRLKAETQVQLFFDYDDTIDGKVLEGIYKAFRVMRNHLREVHIKENAPFSGTAARDLFVHKAEFEKNIGTDLTDYQFEWMIKEKFNPRLEVFIARQIETWYDRKVVASFDRLSPDSQHIAARKIDNSGVGKEILINRSDILELSDLNQLRTVSSRINTKYSNEEKEFLFALARSLMVPNLTFNKQETAAHREAARREVLPVTISIKKGQVIVAGGSKVQPFQLAVIKQIETLQRERRNWVVAISVALFFTILILVMWGYVKRFTHNRVKISLKEIYIMMAVVLISVVGTKIYFFVVDSAFVSKFGHYVPLSVLMYAAPVAAASMMVGLTVLAGEAVWLFSVFVAVVLGIMADFSLSFTLFTFISGIMAARGVFNCKTRFEIYSAGFKTGLVNVLVVGLILFTEKYLQEGGVREVYFSMICAFFGGLLSSTVAMTIVPILETFFNVTTDVKLLELSNLNHPLLKQMIVKAPGTYHHSMLVGSMVEAAAEEIGANPLLGKVMCYYHDIGKMEHPNYFIENQKPGHNPHDHISPFMSKTLLIAHVKDGIELGHRFKLGTPIMDGIIQHHGTTLIAFFYNKALELRAEGEPEVLEDEFRYPGPKPQFRESALCMLADSIEAAARSLDEPTPSRLQSIVRNIIQKKFMDGQLDECNITLKDISKIEMSFIRILLGIYHQRIDYPKESKISESVKA